MKLLGSLGKKSKTIAGSDRTFQSMLTSRLKEARLRAGLSQERLGTLAGLDEMSASSRMNQYERGKHTPGFFLIERLAQALNMPAPWFYTRDDDMAELLVAYHTLSAEQKEKALAYLRELAGAESAAAALDGSGEGATAAAVDGVALPDPPGVPGSAELADAVTYSRSSPGQTRNRTPAPRPSSDGRNRK
ncbi:helix-turn-helix domain-containing protein [Bordetella genomosp. 9]|nr:helix-turn-helix transcriptional regulator [Bordetella genomosp. 9]